MGDFVRGNGLVSNVFWKKCAVEDTATGVFLTGDGRMAKINSSWRQLSGYFHFELNGEKGYITVDGRFDAHGSDQIFWRTLSEGEEIHTVDFSQSKHNSQMLEIQEVIEDIRSGKQPRPSGRDGLSIMRMVETIYASRGVVL